MPRQHHLRLLGRLYMHYHSAFQASPRPYTTFNRGVYHHITQQITKDAHGNFMTSHASSLIKKSHYTNLPFLHQLHSNLNYKYLKIDKVLLYIYFYTTKNRYMKLLGKRNIGYEIWKDHVKRTWKDAFYGGVLRSAWCYDLGTFIQRLNNQALASYCHWIGPFWNVSS